MHIEGVDEQDNTVIEAALGRLVYRAAMLEATIEVTGYGLAGEESEAVALKGLTVGRLADKCRIYARDAPYLNAPMRKALTAILDDVKAAMDLRNSYVHAAWSAQQDGSLVALNSKPAGYRMSALTVSSLNEVIVQLDSIADRMHLWTLRAMELKQPGVISRLPGMEDTAPPYPE
ncbi:hypothetical protein [Streptomyces xylophagus]|uniref:hypothetical protein n=1 Tax=Streptomyces xylophagus TaxID=285514 RepID=UPI00131B83EF|nr:hypothetical protein [Streptomyces xylophagus]